MTTVGQPAREHPNPIGRSSAGAPLAYAALGFVFHLEPLDVKEDTGRLTLACDRILKALGPSLRFVWSSVHGEVEPFSAAGLDLVASFPTQLADPAALIADPRERAGASAMNAAHYDKFGVACHGGLDRNVASPFTFRFYASVSGSGGPTLRADTMIMATLPVETPPLEVAKLATDVGADLRIRWGAAGLLYGAWELDRYGEARDAVYAHARRHPGFDVGQHATWMRVFHDRVRSVSWLTFLGKDLADRVRLEGDLASDDLVAVEPCGEGVVLRAGEQPRAGDTNRRDVPHAYARVDRRIRSVRAAEGVHFYAPWTAATTEAWLRRFEMGT
jgi:hypothetical protein